MDRLFTRPTDTRLIYYHISIPGDVSTQMQKVLGLLADTYIIKDGILTNDGVEWVSVSELLEDFIPVDDQQVIRSFNLVKKL